MGYCAMGPHASYAPLLFYLATLKIYSHDLSLLPVPALQAALKYYFKIHTLTRTMEQGKEYFEIYNIKIVFFCCSLAYPK